jgi:hypothetical protein
METVMARMTIEKLDEAQFGRVLHKRPNNAAPIDRGGGFCGHKVSLNEHCDECLREREAELADELESQHPQT